MNSVTVYLGLGSNVGERLTNLVWALEKLGASGVLEILDCSAVYETEPWGLTDQPKFLNSAVKARTTLPPVQLLGLAKTIEQAMGRTAGVRYGPRQIDIDILLYGDHVIDLEVPDLQVPHPRMAERAFVLIPLAEIAGWVSHPTEKALIADMASNVEGSKDVSYWGQMP